MTTTEPTTDITADATAEPQLCWLNLADLAPHPDNPRGTLGDLTEVSAELRTTITERPDADGHLHRCSAEDGFTAALRSAAGVTVAIDSSFVAPVNLPGRVMVVGADGVLEAVADHRISLRTDDGLRELFTLDQNGGDPHLLPMRRWAERVRDAVRDQAVVPGIPTFADGLACARVMDALRT